MNAMIASWMPRLEIPAGDLLNAVWQGALVTAIVWLMLRTWPRLNAATRFAVWWCTLLAVVSLPAAQPLWRVGKNWNSAGRIQSARAAVERAHLQGPKAEALAVAELEACLEAETLHSAKAFSRALFPFPAFDLPGSSAALIAAILVAGTGIMLVRLGFGLRHLLILKRDALGLESCWSQEFDECAASRAGCRSARIGSSPKVTSPLAIGFRNPMVMLPSGLAGRLSRQEFRHVCLHELAHLGRYDDWTNLVLQLVRALCWFHPALLWVSRQIVLEREIACDDLVIASTQEVKPYARSLMRLAELVRAPREMALAPGASIQGSQLTLRIRALLDRRRDSSDRLFPGGILAAVTLLATSLFACLEFAPVSAQAQVTNPTPVRPFVPGLKMAPATLTPQPPLQPIPAWPVAVSQPKQAVEPLVWDSLLKEMTVMPGAATADFVFQVTNVSSLPVTIESIHPSCGCTVAKAPPMPWTLPAHSDGKVDVSVNLAGKSGTIIKQLSIISAQAPQILNVKITIPDGGADRTRNQQMATADPQAIFKNDCARCHVEPARGKTGAELYTAACGVCHEAAHRATMVPDLHNLNHPTDYTFWKEMIRNGKPNTLMPGFSLGKGGPLSDAQVDSLAELLSKGVPKPVLVNPVEVIH